MEKEITHPAFVSSLLPLMHNNLDFLNTPSYIFITSNKNTLQIFKHNFVLPVSISAIKSRLLINICTQLQLIVLITASNLITKNTPFMFFLFYFDSRS